MDVSWVDVTIVTEGFHPASKDSESFLVSSKFLPKVKCQKFNKIFHCREEIM